MNSSYIKARPLMRLLSVVFFAGMLQACSTVMAVSGPQSRDLSVLNSGTHRLNVLAELGQPAATDKNDSGNKVDVFSFQQGSHAATKGGKAVVYGSLAVLTLGLSEVVTTPLEGAVGNKGAKIQLKIDYDTDDRVEKVVVLKDERWVPIQKLGNQ